MAKKDNKVLTRKLRQSQQLKSKRVRKRQPNQFKTKQLKSSQLRLSLLKTKRLKKPQLQLTMLPVRLPTQPTKACSQRPLSTRKKSLTSLASPTSASTVQALTMTMARV